MYKNKLIVLMMVVVLMFSFMSVSYAKSNSSKESFFSIIESSSSLMNNKKSEELMNFITAGDFNVLIKEEEIKDNKTTKTTSEKIVGSYDLQNNKYSAEFLGMKFLLELDEDKLYFVDSKDNKVYVSSVPEELRDGFEYAFSNLNFDKMSSYRDISNKLRKTAKDCLKDEYFTTTKVSNGMNEYKLKMNSKQIEQFLNSFVDAILKDEELINQLASYTNVSNKEFKETLTQIKALIKLSGLNPELEVSFVSKNTKVTGLSKINVNITAKDFKLNYSLSGEDKKVLSKSKAYKMNVLMQAQNNSIELTCAIKNNEVNAELKITQVDNMNKYLNNTSSSYSGLKDNLSNPKTPYQNTVKYSFKLYTKDNKSFTKASEIYLKVKATNETEYKDKTKEEKVEGEANISIVSNDKKELLKSSYIIINVNVDDEKANLVLRTADKKALCLSSELVLRS